MGVTRAVSDEDVGQFETFIATATIDTKMFKINSLRAKLNKQLHTLNVVSKKSTQQINKMEFLVEQSLHSIKALNNLLQELSTVIAQTDTNKQTTSQFNIKSNNTPNSTNNKSRVNFYHKIFLSRLG